METNALTDTPIKPIDWYSEEFIYNSLVTFLKENGYKTQKDIVLRDPGKTERIITATKFFKKEIIEVKGSPLTTHPIAAQKSTNAITWFTEALFNSFTNFSMIDNAEIAMALPNVSRYRAIIEKLQEYFTVNDLSFRVYLINEDGSVEVSNLNYKQAKSA